MKYQKDNLYNQPVKVQTPSGKTLDLPTIKEMETTHDPRLSDDDKNLIFRIELGLITKAVFGNNNESKIKARQAIDKYSFTQALSHWNFFNSFIKKDPLTDFDNSKEWRESPELDLIGGTKFISDFLSLSKNMAEFKPEDLIQNIGVIKDKANKRTDDKKEKSKHLQVTESPEFIPILRKVIHNIIFRGHWQTLVGETGTGKTILACHLIAQDLKKDKERKAYIYTQESDYSDNIVPSLLAEGMSLKDIEEQIIFKESIDFEKEKKQVFFDINSLEKDDWVLIEPSIIIVQKPNDSKQVNTAIQEFRKVFKEKDIWNLSLHHTTTGWSGTTLKEQGKFAKEWISYPRNNLILKEKEDGSLILFISKSNLMPRVGAIEFKISKKDIEIKEHNKILKDVAYIKDFKPIKNLSTKKILKTYFKREQGVEKPRKLKESTQELRGIIVKYIRENSKGSKKLNQDFVLRTPLEIHCLSSGRFTKGQFDRAIKGLKKDGVIIVNSGKNNRSEYRLAPQENPDF